MIIINNAEELTNSRKYAIKIIRYLGVLIAIIIVFALNRDGLKNFYFMTMYKDELNTIKANLELIVKGDILQIEKIAAEDCQVRNLLFLSNYQTILKKCKVESIKTSFAKKIYADGENWFYAIIYFGNYAEANIHITLKKTEGVWIMTQFGMDEKFKILL